MIPTCWLLSGFFSPEICNPTDVWNPLLATTCLEQGVIRGHATTPFFLLLALLQRHADAVLACATAQEAEDLAQTGCVSVLFPDSDALPEIAEPVRVRVHAFRADALRAGTLHFEL